MIIGLVTPIVMLRQLLVPAVVLLLSSQSFALQIEVRALFGGTALLVIDGREQLVKQGQESREGVKLVKADSNSAVISYLGEEQALYLTDRIGASFKTPEKTQVHISMAGNRQYIAYGSINGRPVRFLVDTGANVVAINSTMARSLGISLADGVPTRASTASAELAATLVIIKKMQVGDIKQVNIQAVILGGEHPKDILLGMSFLQHVDISENAGLMVLTSKL